MAKLATIIGNLCHYSPACALPREWVQGEGVGRKGGEKSAGSRSRTAAGDQAEGNYWGEAK